MRWAMAVGMLALALVALAASPRSAVLVGTLETETPLPAPSPTLQPAQVGRFVHGRVKPDGGYGPLLLVPVRFGQHEPVWMMVDTGATISVLNQQFATSFGLPPRGSTNVHGVLGSSTSQLVTASDWQLGTILLRPAVILAAPLPSSFDLAGLIGSDILGRWPRVELDYGRARLVLWSS